MDTRYKCQNSRTNYIVLMSQPKSPHQSKVVMKDTGARQWLAVHVNFWCQIELSQSIWPWQKIAHILVKRIWHIPVRFLKLKVPLHWKLQNINWLMQQHVMVSLLEGEGLTGPICQSLKLSNLQVKLLLSGLNWYFRSESGLPQTPFINNCQVLLLTMHLNYAFQHHWEDSFELDADLSRCI